MKYFVFDEFEFDSLASEQTFVLAYERKSLSHSRFENIWDFIKITNALSEFSYWDVDKLVFRAFEASELSYIDSIIYSCEILCRITILKQQRFVVHTHDWNLVDVSWEDDLNFYRALWETTA